MNFVNALNVRSEIDILVGTNSQDNPDDGGQPATYGLSDITVVCAHDSIAVQFIKKYHSMHCCPLTHTRTG